MSDLHKALPPGAEILQVEQLTGGYANTTWRVQLADRTVVVKTSDIPVFAIEAAGLSVLRTAGLRTPDVLDVGPNFLTLEALDPNPPDSDEFWEAAGRAIADLHTRTSDRHGWPENGWLGQLPQDNTWDADGHRFFATSRILRYLPEPKVEAALTSADRARIERLCDRIDQLLPTAPAVLTHGDLWRANVVATHDGRPAFIDPSVSWTWAELDLSMMFCTGGVPDRFFAAYHEIHPPVPGWRERMELLNLKELLSVIGQLGPVEDTVARVRTVLDTYR